MNASRRDHWCTNYYFHFTENRKLQFRKIWKASQVVHACNPSIPGDWSRRTIILGPVGQFSTLLRENLSQHEKFKRAVDVAQVKVYSPKLWGKKKKDWGISQAINSETELNWQNPEKSSYYRESTARSRVSFTALLNLAHLAARDQSLQEQGEALLGVWEPPWAAVACLFQNDELSLMNIRSLDISPY